MFFIYNCTLNFFVGGGISWLRVSSSTVVARLYTSPLYAQNYKNNRCYCLQSTRQLLTASLPETDRMKPELHFLSQSARAACRRCKSAATKSCCSVS